MVELHNLNECNKYLESDQIIDLGQDTVKEMLFFAFLSDKNNLTESKIIIKDNPSEATEVDNLIYEDIRQLSKCDVSLYILDDYGNGIMLVERKSQAGGALGS